MSMHMINGVVISHKSCKKKMTKAKHEQLQAEWKEFNLQKKRQHLHHEKMTFDEFVAYKHGKSAAKKRSEFKELKMDRPSYRKTEIKRPEYRSTTAPAKSEPKQYTGSLVKGICQTHKSNLVPVINDEEIIAIGRMRR